MTPIERRLARLERMMNVRRLRGSQSKLLRLKARIRGDWRFG